MAGSTRIGGIHVDLGLGTAQFEKGIKSAKKEAAGLGASLKSSLGGIAKNFAIGLASGVGGITGIVATLRQVAGSVAEIGNEAARAGVTTKVFQEWAHVAERARIPVDALADAFKELAIRGDEFATTGKGSAAEAFARLGLSPAEVKERLQDPADLMLLILDRTRQLGDAAAATRVLDEVLGGQGAEKFAALLGQSNESIRDTIDQAHRLGLVLDDDLIKRAAEIDRQFNLVATTVGSTLRKAIVDAASGLVLFIEQFRNFENMRSTTLDLELRDIGKQRLELESEILRIRGEQADITDTARDLGFGQDAAAVKAEIDALKAQDAALAEQEATILAVLEARRKLAETPSGPTWTPSPYTPPAATGGRDKAAAQAEREADAVRRLIAELEHEKALIGATDLQYEISNTLRQAGAAATDEQRAKITALVSAIYAEEEALRSATEASQELRDIGRDVLGGIVGDLRAGKDAADILASALDRVADRLANMALDSLFNIGGSLLGGFSPTAGGFASMLGIPGRATGGPVQDGMPYIVGERRPELFVPNVPGRIVPRVPSVAGLHGGGGGSSVVELRLSPELTAQILAEAKGQSIRISQDSTARGLAAYDKGKQRQQMTSG